MTFAFNFLPPEGTDASPENSAVVTSTPACITNKNVDDDAAHHPFSWKENLQALLEERSKQEIVFQEVLVQPQDDKNGEDDEDDNETTPLRRVCVDQYQQQVTPGVYEGGLQVWECSLDLVRYFQQHNLRLTKGTALELGCGHALPGCWLLREALLLRQQQQQQQQQGENGQHNNNQQQQESLQENNEKTSFAMYFVDYNEYVIDDVVLSNIVLNTAALLNANVGKLAERDVVRVGSGDWKDMSRQFIEDGDLRFFDWIMAAETTYTTEAAKDTAELLLQHLTIDTGIGWIASKRYYFGVGGGTDALREAAQNLSQSKECPNYLKIETAWVVDNGVSNIREILKVTCHHKE